MAITPDPVGAFTATYKVASDANTEWQRVLLAQQQLAQTAVQQARQNKADDFNQMLKLVSLNQQGEENRLNNAYRRDALDLQRGGQGISRFNADTSRMEARTQARRLEMTRRQSGDPLGLDTASDLPLPSSGIPSAAPGTYAPAASGDDFDLPGGSTGAQPPVLEEFPQNADAGDVPADIPQGGPSSDLFPGDALPQTPPVAPLPAPADQTLPVPGDAPAVASSAQLLPPPVLDVPSFSSVNLPQETRNTLFQLQQQQADLAQQASNAKAEAQTIRRALPRASNQALYNQHLQAAEASASTAAAAAVGAKVKADEQTRALPLLQKRQDALTQLSGLDDVLPVQDRQQLMAEAADPRTGGIADRKINTLNAYAKVRDAYGLEHKSAGYATAEDVARLGAQMSTKEALDDRKAANTASSYRKLIQDNAELDPSKQEDEKEVAKWKAELNKNRAGEAQWAERGKALKAAVRADTAPEAPTTEAVPDGAAAAVVPETPVKPAGVLTAADAQRRQTAAADPANQVWQTAKSTLLHTLGGRQTLIDRQSKMAPVNSLAEFKTFVRDQLRREREFDSASNTEQLSEKDIGLDGLPKNASSFYDVADALAEDLWVEDGNPVNGKRNAGAPPISASDREKLATLKIK